MKHKNTKLKQYLTSERLMKLEMLNGYALSVCSGYGFSSRRDGNGIAKRSGGWNHVMAWIACDDSRKTLNETLFLVQNSWGIWNSDPEKMIIEGSWIKKKMPEVCCLVVELGSSVM